MENIMNIEFKKLVLKNFRCFEHEEFNFHRVTHIFGDNGAGKSSIAEGIVFALYGTNIFGANRTDPLVKQGSESETVAELTLCIDGKNRVIKRVKTPKKIETFCDGIKVSSQKQLQEKILRGLDVKQFLIGFNPLFYDTLDTNSLRETFMSLVVPPSREEVLEQLTTEERRILGDAVYMDREKLKEELKAQEKKKDSLSAQVELLQKQIAEKSASATSIENGTEMLNELKNKLAALQNKKANLEKVVGDPPVAPAYTDVTAIEEQINQARKSFLQFKAPNLKVGDKCPTCGQGVSADALKQLQTNLNAQRNKVIATGQALKVTLEEAKNKNDAIKKAYDKAFAEWQAKQAELAKLNNEIVQVNNEVTANDEREQDRKNLEADLAKKQDEIAELEKDLAARQNVIGSLNAYHIKMVELQTASLLKYLDHVSIKLYEVVKSTGEMSKTFKLLYDGKPAQFLSFSEKIRVGLELGHMFRQLTGVNIPLFLDNTESIGRPRQYNTQSFYAWFVLWNRLQIVNPAEEEVRLDTTFDTTLEEERKAS